MTVATLEAPMDDADATHRLTPWQRIGTDVSTAKTAAEAMKIAGLDWTVDLEPAYRRNRRKNMFQEVPNKFWVTRQDNDVVLASVSERYKIFNNGQAFSFVDQLIDRGDAVFSHALEARGGRTVAISAYVPLEQKILGVDEIEMYLLLRTSHDGSSRVRCDITPVRMFCTNQSGLISKTARSSWGTTHTADVAAKVRDAENSLGFIENYGAAYVAMSETLAGTRTTEDHLNVTLKTVLREDKKSRDDDIAQILNNFKNSPNLADYRETAWGALNAFTEWAEHLKSGNRSDEALFGRVIDGEVAKQRNQLAQRLVAA